MADKKLRVYPRYEVDALANVTGSEVLLYHRIKNLSLGGMCIETPVLEQLGTVVEVAISLPGGGAATLQGEVCWVSSEPPTDMGIRFIDLDEPTRTQLRTLVTAARAREKAARDIK